MNFEDFRSDIEKKLDSIVKYELQEFRFEPLNFGSGILSYKIKGKIHKFIFDGRENQLTWLISKSYLKYFKTSFIQFKKIDGLNITIKNLENATNN